MKVERELTRLGEKLDRARQELHIVEEQLLFQMDVVEEARTRMAVSQTPLADREFRQARDDHDRLVAQQDALQAEIASIKRDQDALLDRMSGQPR